MGLFVGLLGGVVGSEMASVVNGLLEQHGGIEGIMAHLDQQGLGAKARSWMGASANEPISPDQIHQAFGTGTIEALAAKAGMNPQELAQKLSQALPHAMSTLRLATAGQLS